MIYRMVGLDRFADQIKPSVRRRGLRAVEVEEGDDEAPPQAADPADGAGDTPPDAADGGQSATDAPATP